MWVERGYLHLLNNSTSTLTLSDKEFDLIGDKFGNFLEKNMEKVMKSHDRRPGSFKENSKIKGIIEKYNSNEVDLYGVSSTIAKNLFNKRDHLDSEDKTALFILAVGTTDGEARIDYIVGIEFKRLEKYQIDIKSSLNSVVLNPMLLANASAKKTPLFTINLNTMEVSILEDERKLFEQILDVDLKDSMNVVLFKARKCLYNTLTKVEGRETEFQDLARSDNEDKINQVNKFESYMLNAVRKGSVQFEELAKEVFVGSKYQQKEFIKRITQFKVPLTINPVSTAKIDTKMIIKVDEKKEKRIKLANGIEVIVPVDIEEINPIHIQEIYEELVEVVENA